MSTQTLVLSTSSAPHPSSSSSSSSSASASAATASSSIPTETPERRRCWECLRRRLVCDANRPVCNKCRVSGIVCPGYDDKKPLTWLAPGKVTCRTRRKGRPAAAAAAKGDDKTTQKSTNKKKTLKKKGQEILADVVIITKENDIFNGTECLFHSPLRDDVCDVYDAVRYYNTVFYPWTSSGHRDTANVFVAQIPMKIVRFLPTAIAHNLVSIAFQHRMCVQEEWKQDCPSVKHAQARLHHHRGISIRALNDEIANERTQSSDIVLTGVILLLHSEIHSCISPNWRHHVYGLLAMLQCRGGALGWIKSTPQLSGMLLSFLICITMANATSPPFDQVQLAPHEELMELTREIYPLGLHPSVPCPMALFLEIIQINHLRYEASSGWIDKQAAKAAAEGMLKRIEAFEAKEWDGFYGNKDHNDLIGLVFQSAAAVFCVSSLQSVSVLAPSHRMTVMRTVHSNRLFLLVEEARKHKDLRKSLLWPVIVAGMEAGGRVEKRHVVEEFFMDQDREIGTPLPLFAKSVLRKYWDGDDTDWDACFDQPYAWVS